MRANQLAKNLLAIGSASLLLATCASPPSPPAATPERGAQLYARHCAVCHGVDGGADTPVDALLRPRPLPFGDGLFKLVSTDNGLPTADDLVGTLRRGMPGSTMMAWGWLGDDDLRALAREVQRLAVQGRAAAIRRTAAIANRPITAAAATATAEHVLRPGAVVATADAATPGEELLATGARLYAQHCASCHGPDGRGLPRTRDWPTDGTWLWPRDFTSGYLRGGTSRRELAFRIRSGMPGAHMPPTLLSPLENDALVAFVARMIPDGAGDRHAQWRRTIRVAGAGDLAAVEAIRLPTVPLWWRAEACAEAWLRAARDGDELLLELEWADATRDDAVHPDARMSDGVAVQFTREREPPLFAMGTRDRPVNVWRWQAYDPKELAGMADLLWGPLHQGIDVGVTLQLEPRAESIALGGVRSAASAAGGGLPLRAEVRWRDGRWRATFRRALAPRDAREVDLRGGGQVLFAIAIWDGAIDEHAGSKAITTWHVLDLGP
ncbi:MAG: c-type cytochrome [Planctomycetota bacterium]